MEAFRRLSAPCLRAVADAVITSRTSHLAEIVEGTAVEPVARDLARLADAGVRPAIVGEILRALASERERSQSIADSLELVWSGEQAVAGARHTSVVIQQLFEQAQRSVLIASYALAKGDAASRLFGRLAERMDRDPALEVRVFANVERSYSDARSNDEIVHAFAAELRAQIWPGKRMPRVFYDPRALELGPKRACMHAKCVVIDESAAFLTSANFTEAAQERNIEVGLLSHDRRVATALTREFDEMIQAGRLRLLREAFRLGGPQRPLE